MKDRLSRTNGTHYSFEQIICSSPKTLETIAKAKKVARHPVNILLQGESGCGKELFAQSIHNESDRRDAPFVADRPALVEGHGCKTDKIDQHQIYD